VPTEWIVDLTGKVLYLGSCASLGVAPGRLRVLRKESGALAVCGYTRSIDWFESGGLDVMLLSALAAAMNHKPQTGKKAIERRWRRAGDLLDNLGFVCEPDWRPASA